MNNFGKIKAMGGDILAAKAFSRKQAIFNEKASLYAKQGVITTPGYLRLEITAPGTAVSTINWNTLATSGIVLNTERRLKLADTFTICDYSFYLGKTETPGESLSAEAAQARETLHTFPNPQIFGTSADELEAIYNGYISLRVDTTTFLDSIPVKQFYRVGTSQQGVGSSATDNNPVQRDEWGLSMYGKNELLPTIELNGQSNIEWALTLPTATQLTAETGGVNLVLILTGFLNQGAATVQRMIQKRLR